MKKHKELLNCLDIDSNSNYVMQKYMFVFFKLYFVHRFDSTEAPKLCVQLQMDR